MLPVDNVFPVKKISRFYRWVLWLALSSCSGALLLASSGYLYLSPRLPDVNALRDIQLQTPLRIYAADGRLIGEFGEKRRFPVAIEQVPQNMINAFLAAEDSSFYSHNGVNLAGLVRAALELIATGHKQSGGSTITMQVARNFFLGREREFSRKFNEIVLALEIEKRLEKDEIIELYLNKIYLGNRAYGVEAAAQIYYGKSIDQLDLAQTAMIAGLPKAPSRFNPLADRARALTRRNWILRRMESLEMITHQQYTQAVALPISAVWHGLSAELEAPWVAEMVRLQMIEMYGTSAYTDGFVVHTTIRSDHQESAQAAIVAGALAYDTRHGYRGEERKLGPGKQHWLEVLDDTPAVHDLQPAVVVKVSPQKAVLLLRGGETAELNVKGLLWARKWISVNSVGPVPRHANDLLEPGDLIRVRATADGWQLSQIPDIQAAFLSLRPEDGAITALIGGFDFQSSEYNRATQARRQVGSCFKPFVYAAAVDKGLSPATLVNDAPLIFDDDQLERYWRPQNDSRNFLGPIRMREAFYRSRNLASIRLLQRIGLNYTIARLTKMGLPREGMPHNLTLALGTHTLTPLELAAGHAMFANGGFRITPYIIDSVERMGTRVLTANPLVASTTQEQNKPDARQLPKEKETGPTSSDSLLQHSDILQEDTGTSPHRQAPRVLDARVSYIMRDMMSDVIKRGTGRKARVLGRSDLAGKTGTTNDNQDIWFSGFASDLQATVWLGFDQPRPLGWREFASLGPLSIWIDFMKEALKNIPERLPSRPAGLVTLKIDPHTGLPTSSSGTGGVFELFRAEDAPDEPAPRSDDIDTDDEFDPEDIL